MSAALGLALMAGPFLTLPASALVEPAPHVAQLGSDPAHMRLWCYSLRCGDEEWHAPKLERPRFASVRVAGPLPGSGSWIGLRAPATPRESHASYANDWRVGARYGVQALRDGPARVAVQLGAGYRLAPLGDDGIHQPGPVVRGALDFGYRFGERVNWNQLIQWEAGQGQTFVKQSIGLDVLLWPDWTLETDFAIHHDEMGRSGLESAESSVQLHRRF